MTKCQACQGQDCPYSVQMMPNTELVKTLIERPTFLGVVIRSANEVLVGSTHQDFILSYNQQLCPKDLAQILMMAAESLLKLATEQ